MVQNLLEQGEFFSSLLEVDFSITSILALVQVGDTVAPRIGKRAGTMTVTVLDGKTLVIGGLIKEDVRDERKKVPVLGSIPLVGRLFSTVVERRHQTELLVFITPRVAMTSEEGTSITNAETEAAGENLMEILRRSEHRETEGSEGQGERRR